MILQIIFSTWILAQVSGRSLEEPGDLKLTILHVNDIHAHIEQMAVYSSRCRPEDAASENCYGGTGRLLTQINKIRAEDPEHTLLLNAGDFYSGTIWYSLFKYEPLLKFANMLKYDAMGLGNHDFDDGVEGLVPFINGSTFAVLAANINATKEPQLDALCKKSVVKDIGSRKVGIIGYVLPATTYLSNPGENVTFLNEIESVRAEAQRLIKEENITILIALGHSGYELDMQMAAEIEELDVVVGGHSHTFLWPDDQKPSTETIRGPYPTYITQANTGKIVPVVQAYCYSKYLGRFDLYFDSKGELKLPVESVGVKNASPILLDKSIAEDEDVLKVIDEYRLQMTEYTKTVGSLATKLRKGGDYESNIGDALADSMVMAGEWKDEATIAFMNNGGIRSDIEVGEVTGEDVFNVLPFNNTIDKVVMSGASLKKMLEDSVKDLCPNKTCYQSGFLQVSGVRVSYIVTEDNSGHRIQSIKTTCQNENKLLQKGSGYGSLESWCDVEDSKSYTVALPSYMAQGVTRSMRFLGNNFEREAGSLSDYATFLKYLEMKNPLNQTTDGRLNIKYETTTTTTTTKPISSTTEPESISTASGYSSNSSQTYPIVMLFVTLLCILSNFKH